MDKESFRQFLKEAYDYCIPRLVRLTKSKADAEDAFMDAIYQFWKDLQENKVKHKGNLKALILVSARNKWLNKNRKEKGGKTKVYSSPSEVIQTHLDNKEGSSVSDEESYDPLIRAENQAELNHQDEKRKKAMNEAMKKLGKKCQSLLVQSIIHKKKLKELQTTLGYVSINAIKMAKVRCRKSFIQHFETIQNSFKN